MSASRVVELESDGAFDAVRELVAKGWRAIAQHADPRERPGTRGHIVGWCDDETEEGLGAVERANACQKLDCAVVELVEARVHCESQSDGTGIVNCKAWMEKKS